MDKIKCQQWWDTHKFLIGLLLGFFVATLICYFAYNWRLGESKKSGTLIFKGEVYSFVVRDLK